MKMAARLCRLVGADLGNEEKNFGKVLNRGSRS
jgi:hypothetical protein